jgi:hypothetical protein
MLPWTNAHYQQLVGRLVRRGQTKDSVKVHIIRASINDYPYDERLEWNRVRYKRSKRIGVELFLLKLLQTR